MGVVQGSGICNGNSHKTISGAGSLSGVYLWGVQYSIKMSEYFKNYMKMSGMV